MVNLKQCLFDKKKIDKDMDWFDSKLKVSETILIKSEWRQELIWLTGSDTYVYEGTKLKTIWQK
jgi:hypothetical protein